MSLALTPSERIMKDSARVTGMPHSKICIVTSAPICSNPRVVKEADALTAAGYAVRVVASQHVDWVVDWDAEMMLSRNWILDPIRWDGFDARSKWTRLKSGIRQRSFQMLAKGGRESRLQDRAQSRLYDELLSKATTVPSDFLIAHNPETLPVAAAAAERMNIPFAFDSEDFHSGEYAGDAQSSQAFRLLCQIESRYLPQCQYVTAPSGPVADALVKKYGIRRPTVIHNVFSWQERNNLDNKTCDRRGEQLSLYWYSQVIGLDRGLQDVIRAAGLLSTPVQIHLRGELSDDVRSELLSLARDSGVAERVFFHSPVPPHELLSRAAEHDLGLALEQPVNINRTLTVTNKLFFYLLAGLGVVATDTAGQQTILQDCNEVGFSYQPGNYSSLAAQLQKLIQSPDSLLRIKEAALSAARNRWNWEMESQGLVELVRAALWNERGISFVSAT